jgi:YD repeat-containing protein
MIETDRLLLRRPRLLDAAELARIFADEETMRFIGGTVGRAETESRIEQMSARWERDGFGQLVAERREDGRVVGRFGVFTWETITWDTTEDLSLPHEFELGWLLGREFQGVGYAMEAAVALRAWISRRLGPPRLISLVNVDNAASAALARRLGCIAGGQVETARYGRSEIWVHPH